MAAGTLRLANVTVFEANTVSNNIMVPSGTTLEGITDVLNLSLDSASFSTSTSVLSLGRVSGANTVTVDLSSLSGGGGGGGGASLGDVTALAIALG